MQIKSISATNFGSYQTIDFTPENRGLSLIYGPTGAGKSTIPDVIFWTLFGITAKNGQADDVRAWDNLDELTTATLVIEAQNGKILTITRERGKGKTDLYWTEGEESDRRIRGTTVSDSQCKLEQRLGLDARLYSAACYYSESSPSGTFFSAPARARRELLERITDLSLCEILETRISENVKHGTSSERTLQQLLHGNNVHTSSLIESERSYRHFHQRWLEDHDFLIKNERERMATFADRKQRNLLECERRIAAFEDKKTKEINSLSQKVQESTERLLELELEHVSCPTCGNSTTSVEVVTAKAELDRLTTKMASVLSAPNPYKSEWERISSETNDHQERLEELEKEQSPHLRYILDAQQKLKKLKAQEQKHKEELSAVAAQIDSLKQLSDLNKDLRAALLNSSVSTVQDRTNEILERFFDSEFRVKFTPDSDNLEVAILKNGYPCAYRQLSKGQKQLLKLSFSISMMEATSKTAGIHFGQLFLDEALDGMDTELKTKAFALFETLALNHNGVFVIDHAPEFQELFHSKFSVSIENGHSHIEQEDADYA